MNGLDEAKECWLKSLSKAEGNDLEERGRRSLGEAEDKALGTIAKEGMQDGSVDYDKEGVERGHSLDEATAAPMLAQADVQDTTTLLKEFTLVGHGGVEGSPVARRLGRQRSQAKAAAVPAGLFGN